MKTFVLLCEIEVLQKDSATLISCNSYLYSNWTIYSQLVLIHRFTIVILRLGKITGNKNVSSIDSGAAKLLDGLLVLPCKIPVVVILVRN